jgi:hypothetical protein
MSQEWQKDHQGQEPPEPLPVHYYPEGKVSTGASSWDRETEKQLLSQGHQTVKLPSQAH